MTSAEPRSLEHRYCPEHAAGELDQGVSTFTAAYLKLASRNGSGLCAEEPAGSARSFSPDCLGASLLLQDHALNPVS